jgi:hypothetical protein
MQPILAFNDRVLAPSSFDNAAWTKTNATVTPNSTAAPDGTVTADTLSDADAVNPGFAGQNMTVLNDSLTHIVSFYIKAGTAAVVGLFSQLSGGAAVGASIAFNPNTGAFSANNSAAAPALVGVQSLGSGWWRVTFLVTNNNSGNTTLQIGIYPAYAAALAGSGLGFTTNLVASQTGTTIAWGASAKDSFTATYPPINKDLGDELDAVREDSITSSGIKQSVTERIDVFRDYSFDWVPAADVPLWDNMMRNYVLGGGLLTYFPDSTNLASSTDYTLEDLVWKPKIAQARNYASFKIRLRQWVTG